MMRDQGRSIISPEGLLTWTRAWRTAFANAPMKCGPHMAACTAKRSSTGLRPNGKCWRHRRPASQAHQIRRRTHGRPPDRRPPARSRRLADAADRTRDASPCSAAISTKGGDYARGLARRSATEESGHWHPRNGAELIPLGGARRSLLQRPDDRGKLVAL